MPQWRDRCRSSRPGSRSGTAASSSATAVYEVFRIYQGRCWLEDEHFARLRRSLEELEFPPVDLDRLIDRVHRTIAASGIEEGTVYVQITRGVAPRSHAVPRPARAARPS